MGLRSVAMPYANYEFKLTMAFRLSRSVVDNTDTAEHSKVIRKSTQFLFSPKRYLTPATGANAKVERRLWVVVVIVVVTSDDDDDVVMMMMKGRTPLTGGFWRLEDAGVVALQ